MPVSVGIRPLSESTGKEIQHCVHESRNAARYSARRCARCGKGCSRQRFCIATLIVHHKCFQYASARSHNDTMRNAKTFAQVETTGKHQSDQIPGRRKVVRNTIGSDGQIEVDLQSQTRYQHQNDVAWREAAVISNGGEVEVFPSARIQQPIASSKEHAEVPSVGLVLRMPAEGRSVEKSSREAQVADARMLTTLRTNMFMLLVLSCVICMMLFFVGLYLAVMLRRIKEMHDGWESLPRSDVSAPSSSTSPRSPRRQSNAALADHNRTDSRNSLVEEARKSYHEKISSQHLDSHLESSSSNPDDSFGPPNRRLSEALQTNRPDSTGNASPRTPRKQPEEFFIGSARQDLQKFFIGTSASEAEATPN